MNRFDSKTGQPPGFCTAKQLKNRKICFSWATDEIPHRMKDDFSNRQIYRKPKLFVYLFVYITRQNKSRAKDVYLNINIILLIMSFQAWRKPKKEI